MSRVVTQTRQIDGVLAAKQFAQHPIFYFDLGPVLERAGSRLVRNAEGLEVLCRHGLGSLSETDITLFEKTGFYLVVGSCTGAQAEALANRINVALLKLFFGTDSLGPEQLMTLFRMASPGEVLGGKSAALLQTAAQLVGVAGASATPATELCAERPLVLSGERFADVAARGVFSPTRAALCFIPAYDLQREAPALFLCVPVAQRDNHVVYGRSAFGDVSAEQMPFLDEAILKYAVQFSAQLREAGTAVAVTSPVSTETLGWSRGRNVYQKALQHAKTSELTDIIPTIDDVAAGTRSMRLAEMIAAIRSHARRLAIWLPDSETIPDGSGQIGAAGFIVSLPRRSDLDMTVRTSKRLGRLCATQAAFGCLTEVNSEDALDAARDAGIRFCAGTALAPRALSGESALAYAKLLLHTSTGGSGAAQTG